MNGNNQLSFLPDDYMERKAQRRTNVICAVLFIIVMVAIGSAFSLTERSIKQLEKEHARVNSEYAAEAKKIEQAQKMQEKQRKMTRQAELTASLLEKVPRGNILAEITNALPKGVSLIDLVLDSRRHVTTDPAASSQGKNLYEIKKAALEAKTNSAAAASLNPAAQPRVYDVTVKVTGIAPNDVQVAQFITRLNSSKFLSDINLIVSDEYKVQEETLRKFQIEMTIKPGAEVHTDAPPTLQAAVDPRQ